MEVNYYDYVQMQEFLSNPDTRIVDSRIVELGSEFGVEFQVLTGSIEEQTIYSVKETSETRALDLFKMQYQYNRRNNPGLYGLLDN